MNVSQNCSTPRHAQQGLSLVELMVAISLGLFLSWGAIQAFLSGKQTYSTQQALSRMQENARLAQEFMGFDVRNAGTYGCVSSQYVANAGAGNLIANAGNTEFDFGSSVIGAENVPATGAAGLNLATPLDPVPVAGTDILVVHGATDLGLRALTVLPVAPGITTSMTTDKLGLVMGDHVVVSDCTTAVFVTPTSITSAGVTTTIAGAFGSAITPSSSIMRLDTAIYYIANNAAGRPALYRRLLTGVSEELLAGVENLQLEYGLDSVDGDRQVDGYVKADVVTAAQWSSWIDGDADGELIDDKQEQRIRAVRYSLLLISEQNLLETPQTYTYDGNVVIATDNRLRQVVNGTIGIRSMLN